MGSVMNKKLVYPVILLFSLAQEIYAQTVFKYNLPGYDCYSEYIITKTAVNPKGVIVLNANGADIRLYSQSNRYLSSGLFVNYNFLYLNILRPGNSNIEDCIDIVVHNVSNIHHIYEEAFYYLNTDSAELKKNRTSLHKLKTIHVTKRTLTGTLYSIDNAASSQPYKIPDNVLNSGYTDLQNAERMSNYRRNFDVGLYYAPIFFTRKTSVHDKISLGNYGLSFTKSITQNSALKLNLGGSIKRPDQSAIQSGMQSKIMTAVQNDEDTLFINETLKGHVFFGGEINYRYSFNNTTVFRPYISVGIGSYTFTKLSGSITDTLDISNIDMSNPSSMQNAMNPDELAPNINTVTAKYLCPMVEPGFEQRLSPGAKLNISVPFRCYIDQSGLNSNNISLGLNFGLSFCLNSGKLPKRKINKL
jgi:hypothetical protein